MTTSDERDDDKEYASEGTEEAELRQFGIDPELARRASEAHAHIFEALRGGTEPSADDVELVALVHGMIPKEPENDEASMRRALEEAHRNGLQECAVKLQELFASLPSSFATLEHFAGVPLVSKAARHSFLQEVDIIAMGKTGEALASVGLRPSDLLEAIRGMELICRRCMRDSDAYAEWQEDGSLRIPHEVSRAQIRAGGTHLNVWEPLHRWMLDLLRHRPALIDGFEAKVQEGAIVMWPVPSLKKKA